MLEFALQLPTSNCTKQCRMIFKIWFGFDFPPIYADCLKVLLNLYSQHLIPRLLYWKFEYQFHSLKFYSNDLCVLCDWSLEVFLWISENSLMRIWVHMGPEVSITISIVCVNVSLSVATDLNASVAGIILVYSVKMCMQSLLYLKMSKSSPVEWDIHCQVLPY